MPYSDYRPELMGSARLEPAGSFEAGSMQSFTLVYTAGAFGIDDTGSIKIGFRFATDFGPVQLDDPKGPGYTTAEASNGATLETKWEFKRNIRPWSRSLYIGVMKHFLRPGDTITVRFGDRRFGSPGIRVQTYCESAFQFRVLVDAIATYDYVALPMSPSIAIVPGPPAAWQALLPTLVRAGEPFRLALKANDAWGNASDRIAGRLTLTPSRPVAGLPETIACEPGAFAAVAEELRVDEPGDLVVAVRDAAGRELCRSNPLRIAARDAGLVHFWGDTHGQSDETLGTNSARDYFAFGRDKAFLDVMGHQGNDFQITQAFWRELNGLTAGFDAPGRFVCIPGYEWSANTAVGGDRNVHYRHEGEAIHRSSHAQIADAADMADESNDAHDAKALFERLAGKDCVVMAHVGGRYADIVQAHDGSLETAVEVHSAWGTFEWILRDAFEKGYRVGVVCNSDGHKGRPGADFPGASFFGATGGLTSFLAPRLDRDAIFEAMRRRHHYGTTGNRMLLGVEAYLPESGTLFLRDPAVFASPETRNVDRVIMGDVAGFRGAGAELVVDAVGSAPIERLDIFDGLDLIETVRPYRDAELGSRIRVIWEGAEYRGRARTTVWDGALEITGNRIRRAEVLNNWNLDRGIQSQDERRVAWKAVTTGNFGGLDLWLEDANGGTLEIDTRHVRREVPIAEIGLADLVAEAGGLERRLRIYRLPEVLSERRISLRRRLELRDEGDNRLFVRVTQEDGHRAWSSPIYLFRE
ncbi:MAG: DUF3604 domain-containing protein [Hyphomicrobiaceae bacterium]|nr:DUF3604 domain-containing protein [Hyphomicrobiaceae bacterium]